MTAADWPVLRSYDAAHLDRIALPLGGIGTGTICLGGRGDLRDFELGNRPAKGFRPDVMFVAVRAATGNGHVETLVVEGPLPVEEYEGAFGSPAPNHGLPRFAECGFDTAYPFGQVRLRDKAFPLEVTVQGFNPLVFGDTAISSLPVAVLRYRLHNRGDEPVHTTIAMSMSNLVGANGTADETGHNQNTKRESGALHGITMTAQALPDDAEAAGELTMAMIAPSDANVSHRTRWADLSWGGSLLDFWDDLTDDGVLGERESQIERPVASLAAMLDVPGGGTADVTYLLTWNFPNRRAWSGSGTHLGEYGDTVIGNAYSVAHRDSWATAVLVAERLPELEGVTLDAIRAVVDTDAPVTLREAALFNLSTLRSPTVFQSAAGDYYGWEGVGDRAGSCHGTCTHVWGYEFATSLLFAPVARSFRTTQYARCTDESGLMSFRAGLPVEDSRVWRLAAADGQMACLVHLYLDWKLSGDRDLLRSLWPAARRSLEFCWIPGGWDADQDGVMEGVQHNTMDVEYYGPNPQMGSWYLAALRAAEEMAHAVGESDFAERCHALFENGSAWLDGNLFNGDFYRHEVRPVADADKIAEGLRHHSMGSANTVDPDLQLADGCLVDQLVGQYAATLTGLGALLDDEHVRSALLAVHKRNFRRGFAHHFNPMRSFVLADEAAVLMCTYDDDKRPVRPFPYFGEVMTGFEYTLASGLLQVGETDRAMEIIDAIRSRYDGRRRNPFDEAECGHHYARAMASWSAFTTWNAISYSGVNQVLTVGERRAYGPAFWSTGSAFGTWEPSTSDGPGRLRVTGGDLPLKALEVAGRTYQPPKAVLRAGEVWKVT
ncbi:GH116 family glycosyl-hydrolase [Actinopolymorpha singaporensis]|uniref:Uncharacterized protein, contains GBA2_N and DUF608 domains n=1 Tax=Actinopolymorpha singaporensis TaxID=117157 RepID=A0A1H1U4K5_9ACTN|nr:GH116 family glycosyl-hydrolase [Actinopolymorpha singaporensis]SDS67253.1 Uncharacterized protein, contains GBA2_N and DUF608 domains [Actinopolymorpha singaporensis]